MYYLIRVESFTVSSWYIMSDDDPEIKKFFEEYYKSDSNETKLGWLKVGGIERLVKKSENLVDLIESGDLIQHIYVDYPKPQSSISQVKSADVDRVFIISVDIFHSHYSVHKDDILAIYKPNSKGDYIKVWEREK